MPVIGVSVVVIPAKVVHMYAPLMQEPLTQRNRLSHPCLLREHQGKFIFVDTTTDTGMSDDYDGGENTNLDTLSSPATVHNAAACVAAAATTTPLNYTHDTVTAKPQALRVSS